MEFRALLMQEWHDDVSLTNVPWPGSYLTAGDWLAAVAERPDDTLLALVQWAQAGYQLAGRIIVQALLPKLVMMASVDDHAELGDYVTHLWLNIGRFPTMRRRHKLAANLTLDTLKSVKAERGPRPPSTPMLACQPETMTAADVVDAARKLRLISDATAHVLVSVYVDALPGRLAAAKHGLSEAALRKRCSNGVKAISRQRHALAA